MGAARKALVVGSACICGMTATMYAGQAEPQQSPIAVPPQQALQLVQVQVIFRHGARTPLTKHTHFWEGQKWDVCGNAYEAMPLAFQDVRGGPPAPSPGDEKQRAMLLEGGCHKGELTLLGQRQALDLGLWLRRRYVDSFRFLPASYADGILAARTTNFSRTRATLAGVLRGLYPEHQEPIPVVTSSQMDEVLYADSRNCPHLRTLLEASTAMLQVRAEREAEQRQALQQQLSNIMKLPEGYWQQRWHFTDLHDALTSLEAHGKTVPEGLTRDMLQQINRLATAEFGAYISPSLQDAHGHVILRLSMGRMIDKLLANMDRAQASSSSTSSGSSSGAASGAGGGAAAAAAAPRLICYSGHDSTIMPLLTAVGVEVVEWPPYLSNLVFELWEAQQPTPAKPPATATTTTSSSGSSSHKGTSSKAAGVTAASRSSSAVAAADGSSNSSNTGGGDGVSEQDKYFVRVLYNREPLQLSGSSGHDPTLLPYSAFKHGLLQPFILSEQDHATACMVPMSHDGALPKPVSMAAPSDDD